MLISITGIAFCCVVALAYRNMFRAIKRHRNTGTDTEFHMWEKLNRPRYFDKEILKGTKWDELL